MKFNIWIVIDGIHEILSISRRFANAILPAMMISFILQSLDTYEPILAWFVLAIFLGGLDYQFRFHRSISSILKKQGGNEK